ncbi:hypothetical protein [Spongiimicrobium salis]|uniref:hypothetical protein n=1 Tax=Spongiimicrobium salis TaxID=1667022 RepID=UPI00374D7A5D
MSVKGTTYLEVTEHLKTTVPAIKWVDKDRGQLEDPANFIFPRPAVFVSFGFGNYENLGKGVLKGEKRLRIRTVYENYADSHTGSINQEKALAYFEFDEAVHVALEGFSGTHFTGLTKVADEDDLDHANLIVGLFEYQMQLVDDSAASSRNFELLEPDAELVTNVVRNSQGIEENGDDDSPFVIPGIS